MRKSVRPKMTSEEAKIFVVSGESYKRLCAMLENRKEEAPDFAECSCEPYENVYTFARWQALGYHVRKGEKSLRFATWVPIAGKVATTETTDEPQEVTAPRLKPHTTFLFCRCQVDPNSDD